MKNKVVIIFICIILIIGNGLFGTASIVNLVQSIPEDYNFKYMILRINNSQPIENLCSEFEIIGENPGVWIVRTFRYY